MNPPPVPTRRLLPFVAIVLTGFLAIAMPLPVFSLRVHDELGFSLVTAGWVVGIQSLATILTRQWAGSFIDARGPKTAALIGLPLAALSGVLLLLSTLLADPSHSLAVLLVGRLVMGPAESLFLTAAMSWGILTLGPHRTGVVMTWQGIAMFVALGAGAPLGLLLMQRAGFAGVAVAAILLPLIGLLIALSRPAMAPHQARGRRASFLGVIGLVWRQGAVLCLGTAPQAVLGSFVALYFASRGWEGAGLSLTGFGIGFILMRAFFSHLPDRLGGRRVAGGSLLLEAVGQLLLWQAPNASLALLGATLTGAGFSLIFPAMGVEAVRRVPEGSRALAIASFSAFLDVAVGLSGPLAGLIVGLGGYPAVFLAGAIGCLGGVLLLLGRDRPVGGA
ncbi:Predicted arabinose efflux permease, MFS family [Roseomonas rosea]|uniref:Predicted arabinose efflux permease, MFS family n=1 Tax=Muricoccus roseus TaxID=198092 RepID=A0A1M6LW85_9PROT|nr:MFS transporter [Roseomonas rosea]SHJ75442.1 Predicted arabinose efflux permease, MFS family [Roseomonas rosea]